VHNAALGDHTNCLKILIGAKADVNVQDVNSVRVIRVTPALGACQEDRVTCLQLLMDDKADVSIKTETVISTFLYGAMVSPMNELAHRMPGMPFAVHSCNTDSQNIYINEKVTPAMISAHINEYKHIHSFIDEYHHITKHALNEDVLVDKRVGRRGNGIYHEPLERVLEYLGMSMDKNQTVNSSIDGKSVTRALIAGHPTNANLWYELYQRTHCSSCSARPARLKTCTCDTARYCNNKCQRNHWPTHKPSHKAVILKKKKPV
jgi:hypothetical protein